jgi:hypothetical protein
MLKRLVSLDISDPVTASSTSSSVGKRIGNHSLLKPRPACNLAHAWHVPLSFFDFPGEDDLRERQANC